MGLDQFMILLLGTAPNSTYIDLKFREQARDTCSILSKYQTKPIDSDIELMKGWPPLPLDTSPWLSGCSVFRKMK